MNTKKINRELQLDTYSRYWFYTLIITLMLTSFFYFIDTIEVENILQIQFSEDYNNLISKIKSKTILKSSLYYDFCFITFYTLLFWMAIKVFDLTLLLNINKRLYLLILIPGFFDFVENGYLLMIIDNVIVNDDFFSLFWFSVRAKWLILIPFLLINLIILFYYIVLIFNRIINKYYINKVISKKE